ncbi:MAG: restriction endonuclease [Anaerolineae bacterium]|nr:restriction endonuclease [Anaerolineae bacterium]MCB9106805.1 restriction endonuclease [Anaerolineales bacterium]
MAQDTVERIEKLSTVLKDLNSWQLELVEQVVEQFRKPYISIDGFAESDIVSECFLNYFGDILKIHHTFSKEAFTKDKFEYALERVSNLCRNFAQLAPRGNPGHDITINGVKISLKTQADINIRVKKLHISKFMELGKGEWSDSVENLEGLRKQFLAHLEAYERIFSLRCLSKKPEKWHYELVEIPKSLLDEARNGNLRIVGKSSQTPKPGYCDVTDETGELKFQLYFDGGTERKLQIKNLLKNYCIVHANWIFSTELL